MHFTSRLSSLVLLDNGFELPVASRMTVFFSHVSGSCFNSARSFFFFPVFIHLKTWSVSWQWSLLKSLPMQLASKTLASTYVEEFKKKKKNGIIYFEIITIIVIITKVKKLLQTASLFNLKKKTIYCLWYNTKWPPSANTLNLCNAEQPSTDHTLTSTDTQKTPQFARHKNPAKSAHIFCCFSVCTLSLEVLLLHVDLLSGECCTVPGQSLWYPWCWGCIYLCNLVKSVRQRRGMGKHEVHIIFLCLQRDHLNWFLKTLTY